MMPTRKHGKLMSKASIHEFPIVRYNKMAKVATIKYVGMNFLDNSNLFIRSSSNATRVVSKFQ
jgi:hypothetical protein